MIPRFDPLVRGFRGEIQQGDEPGSAEIYNHNNHIMAELKQTIAFESRGQIL